ncbi:MAG: glycosyltransferase family 2 protein [Acidobacteria bacterium]|nr:glycosyltransferase family 2 protein [Acidobacteriota bacterium]
MTGPLVSIVVPVYNVEAYLPQCLDSLLGQTLEPVEVVCVNDASTDGSLAILGQYAARDARIRVIDKPTNEGLSVTRNVGMAAATGTWVAFLDSDDVADPDLCRKALACAESSGADLVIYDYAGFWSAEDLGREQSRPSSLAGVDATDRAALLLLHAYAWTKFLRASHLRALGVQFPAGMTYEDQPFHWALLTRTDRVALLPERLCLYRQRRDSIGYRSDWSRANLALVCDQVRDDLVRTGSYERYRETFIRHRLQAFRVVYDTIDPTHRKAVERMVVERMDADHWAAAHSDRGLDRRTRDFLLALEGDVAAKVRRSLWLLARDCYRLLRRPPLAA